MNKVNVYCIQKIGDEDMISYEYCKCSICCPDNWRRGVISYELLLSVYFIQTIGDEE